MSKWISGRKRERKGGWKREKEMRRKKEGEEGRKKKGTRKYQNRWVRNWFGYKGGDGGGGSMNFREIHLYFVYFNLIFN